MQPRDMTPHEILLPVRPAFIAFTLIAALMVNLLPWSGPWLTAKPDFVALIVLYWCIQQPRRFGFAVAWLMGLMMDVAVGSLLGQHALAYSVLAYAGIVLHRRVLMFGMRNQILHVIPILLLNNLIVLAIRKLGGADFPGYGYFAGSLIAGALWPVMCFLLKLPQRPTPGRDHA
ncbi:MAG: rod shape-determining protein MreD [Pseudomonadota bacterium]|mgnify:FL=1